MSARKTLVTLSILIGATACGGRDVSMPFVDGNGIVHGKSLTTKSSVAQTVVALVSEKSEGQALCTGTILSEGAVLTAAHCVDQKPEKMFVVFAPNLKSAKKENVRAVDSFVQNPRWKKSKAEAGDLAIVHFVGGLPEGFEPVVLAPKGFKLSSGEEVVMAGFGVSNTKRDSGAGSLRETKTTIIGSINKDQIATDGRTSSVCFGDSGGPAFAESKGVLVQWGIAHSVVNKDCNETSLHTTVMPYEGWIRSEMKKLSK